MPGEWRAYARRRYSPALLAGVAGYAVLLVSASVFQRELEPHVLLPVFFGLHLFLQILRLRVLDDIGDIDSDRVRHPDRPLPMGTCSTKAAWYLAWSLFGLELSVLLPLWSAALLFPVLVSICGWVLHRQFYLPAALSAPVRNVLVVSGNAFFPAAQYLSAVLVFAFHPVRRTSLLSPRDAIITSTLFAASLLVYGFRILVHRRGIDND